VCIAFMHRKSRKFLRFQIKLVTKAEVSLELMELNYKSSAIDFNVTFVKILFWVEVI
jgi:hypothetical protein